MSTPASSQAFSVHATEYTALRRRLVARYDDFYGAAVDALSLPGVRKLARVLDLGAGTGLFSELVAGAFPAVRLDLLDGSEAMLAEARERLNRVLDATYVQDMAAGLPAGPYDAVISALAIHHLEDPDKRVLFDRVFDALAPGGVFVNAEQVGGTTPELDRVCEQRWALDASRQGASESEIGDARRRREHDRCASVPAQLAWLADAGFGVVECVYRYWGTAVFVAIKEGPR